jgi:hypothetical protein
MSTDERTGGGLKVVGLGALACIGCCAGPLLAFLGGISVAGLASAAVVGGAGLVIAAMAAVAYVIVRRRRALACKVTTSHPVPVTTPTRRVPASSGEEVPVP